MNESSPPDDPTRRVPSPKRGAFPTPREVIEQATPYVPGDVPRTDAPAIDPAPPTSADDNKPG